MFPFINIAIALNALLLSSVSTRFFTHADPDLREYNAHTPQTKEQIKNSIKNTFESILYILNQDDSQSALSFIADVKEYITNDNTEYADLIDLRETTYTYQNQLTDKKAIHEAVEKLLLNIKSFIHDNQIGDTYNLNPTISSYISLNLIKDNLLNSLNENLATYTSDISGSNALTSDLLKNLITIPGSPHMIDGSDLRNNILSFEGGPSQVALAIISNLNGLPETFTLDELELKLNVFNDHDTNFTPDLTNEVIYRNSNANLVDHINFLANQITNIQQSLSSSSGNAQLGTLGSFYSCPSASAVASEITLIAEGSNTLEGRDLARQKCNNWAFLTEFENFGDYSLAIDGTQPHVYVSTSPEGPCFDAVGGFFVPKTRITGLGDSNFELLHYNLPVFCEDHSCHSYEFNYPFYMFNFVFPSIPFACANSVCTSQQINLACSSSITAANTYTCQDILYAAPSDISSSDIASSLIIPELIASAVPASAGSLATFCMYELDHVVGGA